MPYPIIRSATRDRQPARHVLEPNPTTETNLIRRYAAVIRRMLLRKTGCGEVAEDLLQDTFGLVIEKIRAGKVRQPEKLSGYIYRIARNLFVAHVRREASRQKKVTVLGNTPSSYANIPPDQALERREEARLVHQVLSELKLERDRQILFRFYLLEERREEICSDLAIGAAQFNLVLHRARTRFKLLWQKQRKK